LLLDATVVLLFVVKQGGLIQNTARFFFIPAWQQHRNPQVRRGPLVPLGPLLC